MTRLEFDVIGALELILHRVDHSGTLLAQVEPGAFGIPRKANVKTVQAIPYEPDAARPRTCYRPVKNGSPMSESA